MELVAYVGSIIFSAVLYVISIFAPLWTFMTTGQNGYVLIILSVAFSLMLIYVSTNNILKSTYQYKRHKKINPLP